jgi:hypothetical protein
MRPPKSWNVGQRVVLVIASALVLSVVAHFALYQYPEYAIGGGGWFGYAPGSGGSFNVPMVGRFNDAMTAILTIGFIAMWVAISLWLLADREGNG